MFDLKDIFAQEADITINRYGANIFKAGITLGGINRTGQNISGSNTGANASGKTIQSIKATVRPDGFGIEGRDDIWKLETGISPSESKVTPNELYVWSKYKQIPFTTDKKRFFAAKAWSANQRAKGSLLFRFGGRKDIFTSETTPLIERLLERIEKRFYDINILE